MKTDSTLWRKTAALTVAITIFAGCLALAAAVSSCGNEDLEVGGTIPPPVVFPTATPDTTDGSAAMEDL